MIWLNQLWVTLQFTIIQTLGDIKAKQPESGDLYDAITQCGVV